MRARLLSHISLVLALTHVHLLTARRYDFAPHFLKEYISYVPSLQRTFRVLFGISVEVSENGGQENPGAWRRDFSDPIYLHAIESDASSIAEQTAASLLQDDESSKRFEMVLSKVPEIFNGDGCDASNSEIAKANPRRQPIRKSALVEVLCRRCVPADARWRAPLTSSTTRRNLK